MSGIDSTPGTLSRVWSRPRPRRVERDHHRPARTITTHSDRSATGTQKGHADGLLADDAHPAGGVRRGPRRHRVGAPAGVPGPPRHRPPRPDRRHHDPPAQGRVRRPRRGPGGHRAADRLDAERDRVRRVRPAVRRRLGAGPDPRPAAGRGHGRRVRVDRAPARRRGRRGRSRRRGPHPPRRDRRGPPGGVRQGPGLRAASPRPTPRAPSRRSRSTGRISPSVPAPGRSTP